jgi:hypothetical protein
MVWKDIMFISVKVNIYYPGLEARNVKNIMFLGVKERNIP